MRGDTVYYFYFFMQISRTKLEETTWATILDNDLDL